MRDRVRDGEEQRGKVDRVVYKRVQLCADQGRSARLSDPALCLTTPALPVFSLNPVVAFPASPHLLSHVGVSAVGTSCWLLGGASGFGARHWSHGGTGAPGWWC